MSTEVTGPWRRPDRLFGGYALDLDGTVYLGDALLPGAAATIAAIRAAGSAVVFLTTNPDPYCPTPDGGLPDCAAMLAAIEACTGARAEAVVGKPSEHMAEELLRRLAAPPGRAAVVGDRLLTDVRMGQSLGMAGVLVLSGATTPADLAAADVRPDYVIDG